MRIRIARGDKVPLLFGRWMLGKGRRGRGEW